MSKRSLYLRDQAASCEIHAAGMTSLETQAELRRLAAQYLERAAFLESRSSVASPSVSVLGRSAPPG